LSTNLSNQDLLRVEADARSYWIEMSRQEGQQQDAGVLRALSWVQAVVDELGRKGIIVELTYERNKK
jgi:hypothetical protein